MRAYMSAQRYLIPRHAIGVDRHFRSQERSSMSTTSFTKFTAQLATIGALVAVSTGVAGAQKAKPAGPPVTTHGEVKAAAPAAKGQANAEANRTDAGPDKAPNVHNKQANKTAKHP